MSEPSKYNSFTAADIERYYEGQMSAAERHALEKAALDDPFLADALEGYAFTSTPLTDINAIQQRLNQKQKRKKIVPLYYKWIQIAALFVLLAGSGWFLYRADFFSKKEIAARAPAPQKQRENFSSNKLNDSVRAETANPSQVVQPQTRQADKAVSSSKKNKKPAENQELPPAEKRKSEEPAAAITALARPQKNNQATLTTRSANPDREAPAGGKLDAETNNQTITYKNKSAAPPADSVFGYSTIQGRVAGVDVSNDTIKLNVTMQPAHENLNEVVMVHAGAKKRAIKPVAKFEQPEPVEGWTAFNEYISLNLKEPEDLKVKADQGGVELSFEINGAGEPINIKVEKSLCGKCDEEAIRLLKDGPKWKTSKTNKGKVTIRF